MGKQTTTVWTCDRCKSTTQVDGDNTVSYPQGWTYVSVNAPAYTAVMCPSCMTALTGWVSAGV